jgi:hypothetical protein
MKQGKPPVKDVEITFTITEDTEGKLGIKASIPDHAAGTIALVVAQAAIDVMQGMMKDAGVPKEYSYRGRVQ